MRVLVADDDMTSLVTLESFLSGSGYDVATATNGQEAFEMIQAGDYRLVISDWEMPGMDGPDLCRMVRQRQFGSYVYLILLTGRRDETDLVNGLNAGADDFIRKPFKPDELRVRLRAAERIVALESRDVFAFSLSKLAESRDLETGAHLDRIREYSRILAEGLGKLEKYRGIVDADYVRTIYATSPLHDIGKVGIPDNILLKPGQLTSDEYEVMKTHTLIGCLALDPVIADNPSATFYRFARDIVLTHHERYDGKGYPNGLVGEEIPLCGRIVSVADVYDALTMKRVYKPAFPHEHARDIIVHDREKAFDPDVVDVFLEKEEDFIRVRSQLENASEESSSLPDLAVTAS